ncbi:MAG: type 1 glutamine amidotransferase, partial [Thermoleophilaceae bacterium]
PVELDEDEPLPDWRAYGALLVMGGPMGSYDEVEHPWLVAEKRCIREAVSAGRPFFGACLGSQLLAASLGAGVYRCEPEVGVLDVELTAAGREDPVMGGLPPSFATLQWHGDTFDLPSGAVRLAGSPAYPNQAFRVGSTAYAVQFHLEVTSGMAAEWATVPSYARALEEVRGPGALDELLTAFEDRRDEMHRHARHLFTRWLETWAEPGRARAAQSRIECRVTEPQAE